MNIETNDFKLWEDFKKGDKKALSHIYHLYVVQLFRYGKKFTSEDEVIKDTIQDLFFDLIRTRSNLGSTDHIYFYLMKAMRHKLLRQLKTQHLAKELKDQSLHQGLNIVYSIEDELIKKEDRTRRELLIEKGLSELSPKQREILYYRYTCDLDYDQICDLMSMKYDSARKMVFRALKSLKGHLNESNFLLVMLVVRQNCR